MQQSAILAETEFRLDGELSELSKLAAEVAQFCRAGSLPQSVEFKLNLVLEELFANAVMHGGCKGMKDAVTVALSRENGAVSVAFLDRGVEFDPTAAPAPDLDVPLDQRSPGGLGLHFVRSLAQIVEYRRQGGCNRLHLRVAESA
jgi:anti-sigma regulatory factor (Ser/Thr protein kinase)